VGNGKYYTVNFAIYTTHLALLGWQGWKKSYKMLIWKTLGKLPLGRSRTMGSYYTIKYGNKL
jgi:hypothetical protein